MKHRLGAYKDGYKWVTFCEICGQDEPEESADCQGDKYGIYTEADLKAWLDLTIPKKLPRY